MKNQMRSFALRPFYILTWDRNGEYVRKIKLYNSYYEALCRFVVINDEIFEAYLYSNAYLHSVYHDHSVHFSLHEIINDLLYDNSGNALMNGAPYNKPASLMGLEKRENLHQLAEDHQRMRKQQYEAQFTDLQEERPFYVIVEAPLPEIDEASEN